MGHYILVLPGNIYNSLGRPTREITEDISAVLSLLFTVSYTGARQNVIHNYKEYYDKDSRMANVMNISQDPMWIRSMRTRRSLVSKWRR